MLISKLFICLRFSYVTALPLRQSVWDSSPPADPPYQVSLIFTTTSQTPLHACTGVWEYISMCERSQGEAGALLHPWCFFILSYLHSWVTPQLSFVTPGRLKCSERKPKHGQVKYWLCLRLRPNSQQTSRQTSVIYWFPCTSGGCGLVINPGRKESAYRSLPTLTSGFLLGRAAVLLLLSVKCRMETHVHPSTLTFLFSPRLHFKSPCLHFCHTVLFLFWFLFVCQNLVTQSIMCSSVCLLFWLLKAILLLICTYWYSLTVFNHISPPSLCSFLVLKAP